MWAATSAGKLFWWALMLHRAMVCRFSSFALQRTFLRGENKGIRRRFRGIFKELCYKINL